MDGSDGTSRARRAHGGDRLRMAAASGRKAGDILDFSANVRPDGAPQYILNAVTRALSDLAPYPSPRAEEAVAAAAARYGIAEENIVFGNGTAELIFALARALTELGAPLAVIPEPAFGEYGEACRLAGLAMTRPVCALVDDGELDWELPEAELLAAPAGAVVFLANPGNPAGTFLARERVLSLARARPDMAWIVDEAFLPYLGQDDDFSLLPLLAAEPGSGALPAGARVIVLRSLTKFHGLAGLRVGWMAASGGIAGAVRDILPSWNVNALALAAARAVMAGSAEERADAAETRARNEASRADLLARLEGLPLRACRSRANYLLLRLDTPRPRLSQDLLGRHGVAVRDCSDYPGLEAGRWVRVAVRAPAEHARLAAALRAELCPPIDGAPPRLRGRAPALMLQGTSSHAGKSVLTAAFCRIFRQDGLDPCPFKAQNMSLNSGVTADGGEMGRAQVLQAQAAGLDPDVRMNPVLLKPHSDMGSQVVVLGHPLGHMDVRAYFREKAALMKPVLEAYDGLSREHGVMVIEGAGSPGEVNLKRSDIVNMAMARAAGASVLLAGDIDRGGLYASFLGTWMTFSVDERRLLKGYVVNRFRGDASLLGPAHDYMLAATGVPVLGTVPYIRDLDLPEEDSLAWSGTVNRPATMPDALDVAAVMLGHCANYTDLAPLGMEPDVNLRSVRRVEEWGEPHLVVIPGSKNVAADLAALRERGLAARIMAHAARGGWVLGVCGGMQVLGEAILDPDHVESRAGRTPGLGLLPLETTLSPLKTLLLEKAVGTPLNIPTRGYEIHHGVTRLTVAADGLELAPFTRLDAGGQPLADDQTGLCGVACGHTWGAYLHGLLDDDRFRRAFLDHVRATVGLAPQGRQLIVFDVEKALNRLADIVRRSMDMEAVYRMLGVRPTHGNG